MRVSSPVPAHVDPTTLRNRLFRPARNRARRDEHWVGIELRRARCRWKVTFLALSIARWVHISTMATFPEAPYNPGQPVFPGPVRSLGQSFFLGPSQPQRGLSADSHTPQLLLVCPGPSSMSRVRLLAGAVSGRLQTDET